MVLCDIRADAELEKNQVLVVRASPHPQTRVLDQHPFHFIAGRKRQKESWVINRPVIPSPPVPAALSDEGELGVVASPPPHSMCEGWREIFAPYLPVPFCVAVILEECYFEYSFLILSKQSTYMWCPSLVSFSTCIHTCLFHLFWTVSGVHESFF